MRNLPAVILWLSSGLLQWGRATATRESVERKTTELAMPACYKDCFAQVLPSSSCYHSGNASCVCADPSFLAAEVDCFKSNCTVIEALQAQRYQVTQTCPEPIRDRSNITARVAWTMLALATFSVFARVLARMPALGGSGYGLDDWTIFLSLTLLLPAVILIDRMTREGLGRDMWMLSPNQTYDVLYIFWIEGFLYGWVLGLTKASIIFLYLRMWPDPETRNFRLVCFSVIGFLVAVTICVNIIWAIQCRPTSYIWTRWDGEHDGWCINSTEALQATIYAGVHITLDVTVILLPIPKLVGLSLSSTRKKVAVCFAFLIGLLVTAVSCFRVQYLRAWGTSYNSTWLYNPITMWSNIECGLSIVCACVPSLAGLFQRLWFRLVDGIPMRDARRRGCSGGFELSSRSNSITRLPSGLEGHYDGPQDGSFAKSPFGTQKSSSSSQMEFGGEDLSHRWAMTKPLPPVSHLDDY